MKRVFYSQGGKHYLLVGVPWSWMNAAPAGTLIIDPTTSPVNANADVWLESSGNTDGSFAGLLIGKAGCCPKKRTLVEFDVASSGIPADATILNSQMKLYYYSAANVGAAWVDRWVRAHQVLVDWHEAQANYDDRLTGVDWNADYVGLDGVDAKSTYESTLLFKQNEYPSWKSWDLSRLTEYWIDNPLNNFGVVLWATNEDVGGYDLRFHSSDAPPPNNANPPKLEVLWSNPSKTVYFLKDHLGSIRATVDQTGTVKGYDDYDPWGYILAGRSVQTPWSNPDANSAAKNKFTGKERDDEFGINLDYFGARYYDPQIGRWMSVDPQEAREPSLAPYVYSFDNPQKFVDPDGEWPTGIHNRILQEAFKGLLTKQQIGILQKASARVDEDQSPAGAFKHAMRHPFQPEEHAKLMMELFIQGREKEFFEKSGDEALTALGEALHAITDATSPAHVGFQVWHGLETPEARDAATQHFLRERDYQKEQLTKIAAMVRQYYLDLLKKKEAERKKKEEEKKRKEEERRKKEEERKRKEAEKRYKR